MDTHRRAHRQSLYRPIDPYTTGMLDVGDGHILYYEECGRADGVPVIGLHGGPGGGASPAMRRFFDPTRYRIILFDQRGCGRSHPYSSLHANTTAHLVSDMEKLRTHLGVDRWLVFGGSWGVTLALSYARQHADHVLAMVLRGIFLCTQKELNWFYRDGANILFPDAWANFVEPLSVQEREDVLGSYYARMQVDNVDARRRDVLAWAAWESALISMSARLDGPAPDPYRADALSRIETHYFAHRGFLEQDGALLDAAKSFTHLPATLVQGRYDMVTPVRAAWELAKAWPNAHLDIVPDAGHAAGEPGIIDALVRATDAYARRFG
ncbi:prolyl aminopeptidase [Woodsholea maritima]|uniref:prolyl aminopeptidase n=1 Tax=Woodsholea maritima TaxID=240237 RepID=UPI000378688C|nr:prolyl aminopeptidase [Woodsholea maritima]